MPKRAKEERPWSLRSLNLLGKGSLRSCPFCHSSDLGIYEYTYSKLYAVDCKTCGAQGPRNASPPAAQELWNTRADDGDEAGKSND